nr:DUF4878 domain-containing protein [Tumebacillus avium]
MKMRIVSITLSLVLFAVMVFITSSFVSAESEEKEAREAVELYISAVTQGDVQQIVKLSKDERETDEGQRKEWLERYVRDHPVKKFEISSFNYVDEDSSTVTLSGQFGEFIETATLPLIKENGQWKVLIRD